MEKKPHVYLLNLLSTVPVEMWKFIKNFLAHLKQVHIISQGEILG